MTKRPQPKFKPPRPAATATSASTRQATEGHGRASVTAPPRTRPTYIEAVGIYEKGIEALQRHDYNHALELLQSVLRQYPEEKELHERVRLYLNICERHATPREAAPQSIEERLYASTLAINGGRYDEAISHLRLVRDEDPDNDHALYMLAVARRDPDLEPLHDDDAFRGAVDSPGLSRLDPDRFTRRPPFRSRTGR